MNRELFELIGLGWRLPVWMTQSENGIEVTLADIPLLKIQCQTAEAMLDANCAKRNANIWFFSKDGLNRCALKSAATDPEGVVVWTRTTTHEADPGPDGFIRAFCRSSYAPAHAFFWKPGTMAIIWQQLCQFMLEWLVLRDGQIDFGFAKLNAFCARANWKSLVIGRHIARNRHNGPTDSEKTRRELRRSLHQNFMTAFDEESRTVKWTLEITPQNAFEKAAEIRELKRKQKKGGYAFDLLRLLKSYKTKDRMFKVLEDYRRQSKAPCLSLPHGFEPAAAEANAVKSEPAPPWVPEPVVSGKSGQDKSARVTMKEEAFALRPDDLLKLSNFSIDANFIGTSAAQIA